MEAPSITKEKPMTEVVNEAKNYTDSPVIRNASFNVDICNQESSPDESRMELLQEYIIPPQLEELFKNRLSFWNGMGLHMADMLASVHAVAIYCFTITVKKTMTFKCNTKRTITNHFHFT
jgi:hypothetical protein